MWEKAGVDKIMGKIIFNGETIESSYSINPILKVGLAISFLILLKVIRNFNDGKPWDWWPLIIFVGIILFTLITKIEKVSFCEPCGLLFDFGVDVCTTCDSPLAKIPIDQLESSGETAIEDIPDENREETDLMYIEQAENYDLENEKQLLKEESISEGVNVGSSIGYKGATIIYKVKIENNTNEPISDIKIYPYVPTVFLLKEKERSITLIQPKSSQTATFEIRPTGECGDCNVSGRINYYDMISKKYLDIDIRPKSLSIVCPMLHRKEITEDAWRDLVSGLVKAEETTTDVPVDGEGLFGIISEILKDLNLFMLTPGINKAPQLFRGTARFYGEGVKGLRYAAQIEVVGGARKSKLILKAWAEKEDALTGFYHGVLDEIEKRVKVKEYIDDSIVQYNVHIGDKIGTLVKDSVVQRSTFGATSRKCPNCGREVEANEKFCLECGAKL